MNCKDQVYPNNKISNSSLSKVYYQEAVKVEKQIDVNEPHLQSRFSIIGHDSHRLNNLHMHLNLRQNKKDNSLQPNKEIKS